MSIAFLFSGQGAQSAGMGEELYHAYPIVKQTIDAASAVLGEDIPELSFTENEKMNWTPYTQPILLAWSHAFSVLLKEYGITPAVSAGLSLGEYTALVSAGVLSYEEALTLVHKRGRFMDEACPKDTGAMSAVLGLDREIIETVCSDIQKDSYVAPANYNMPGQIVIGGEKQGVEVAGQQLLDAGAKKVVPLDVSGPFHTKLLKPAAENLSVELAHLSFKEPEHPVYSNTLARAFYSKDEISTTLVRQVMEPVYFEDMIRQMIEDGVTTFIEVGPGKILSRFVKKIDKSVLALNIQDIKSLEKIKEAIELQTK